MHVFRRGARDARGGAVRCFVTPTNYG